MGTPFKIHGSDSLGLLSPRHYVHNQGLPSPKQRPSTIEAEEEEKRLSCKYREEFLVVWPGGAFTGFANTQLTRPSERVQQQRDCHAPSLRLSLLFSRFQHPSLSPSNARRARQEMNVCCELRCVGELQTPFALGSLL